MVRGRRPRANTADRGPVHGKYEIIWQMAILLINFNENKTLYDSTVENNTDTEELVIGPIRNHLGNDIFINNFNKKNTFDDFIVEEPITESGCSIL